MENKNPNKIIIIDIETTKLSRFEGKIVEIGITELNLLTGERKIIFDSVMHEDGITKQEIEESWIINNSTLTLPAILYSRNLKILKPYIQAILNEYPLGCTAFNNSFDFNWLENRGFTFPQKLDCPMVLAQPIVGAISTKTGKIKRPNVEEAYEYFANKKLTELHRGADDSYQEALIVYELYKLGVFKTQEQKDKELTEAKNLAEQINIDKNENINK